VLVSIPFSAAFAQRDHGSTDRAAIDKMRDKDLQPERVVDVITLRPGMVVGEAGASYGYFTFKMSKRVGDRGTVYANDIDPAALQLIEGTSRTERITNIRTVLGAVDDPRFPRNNLDMVVVFDCLFEFEQPARWMRNTRKYLKPGRTLVIVDPDPSKFGTPEHFLSRTTIQEYARESGFAVVRVEDAFLKSHLIIVLQPVPLK